MRLKRLIDIMASIAFLIVLTLPFIVLALVIRLRFGSPILFCQLRPGLHGKPFLLRKFRTMRHAYGSDGLLLPDAKRLTSLGRWLRSTSLDELPELWNILCGDMSLVGPRPLLIEYLSLYTPEQARRHEALPGLTGWAQINGRNAISWEERFALDVWYVDHHSLRLDFLILWRTLWKVLRRDGITAAGEATVAPFRGPPQDQRLTSSVDPLPISPLSPPLSQPE